MLRKLALGFLAPLVGVLLCPVATDGASFLKTKACALPGVSAPARCGVFETPEVPDHPEGRRLSIHFAILPALSPQRLNDPLVLMMGGPGEDAISDAADAAVQFAQLRNNRDILLVDQRGAGLSGPLHCDLFTPSDPEASLLDLFPRKAVAACARRLSAGTDLTRYTYDYAARDLEAIRLGLGYGPLNLVALSYGARAAQVYMRAYPSSVRTAYLGSVVPVDLVIPLTFARTAQSALDRLISDCEEDTSCHTTFPTVRQDVRKVFGQLDGNKVRVQLPGQPHPVALNRGRVSEWVRSRLYRPASASTLPKIFHQAAGGDWSPIVDGVLASARGADSALELGLLFSITCSEDVAYVREQDIPAASDQTFLGSYRLRQQQGACTVWPKRALPLDYREPVRSSIPTLFVTADRDGDTPLWFTDHVAAGFSRRAIVVVHGQGHTGWNDCVARLHRELVLSGKSEQLQTACPPVAMPPFAR